MALRASTKGIRLLYAARSQALLYSTSTPPPSRPKQDPSSSTQNPNVASESTEANPTGSRSMLPSLDFDPASESSGDQGSQGRTGAKSSKDSLSSIEKKRKFMTRMTLAAATMGAIAGGIYMGREWEEDEKNAAKNTVYDGPVAARWGRSKARFTGLLDYFNKPAWNELLPPGPHKPYTLLISLDDLLITSTWDRQHGWRTAKRPGVDYFLAYLSQFYEVVVFTTQQQYTAAPVLEKLDPYTSFIAWKLFRESTRSVGGKVVKDLSYLNRDLSKVILVDTDPDHAFLQPENAIILPKWKGHAGDKGLVGLIPFLESIGILQPPDVRPILTAYAGKDIAAAYAAKEKEMKEKAIEEWRNSAEGKRAMSRAAAGSFTFSSLFGGQPAEDKDKAMAEMGGGTLLGMLSGAVGGEKKEENTPASATPSSTSTLSPSK
ncbi:mitochondrial inner membrane protein required for protein import [Tulasnella sp. 418]|nr:mitochondrial inner membrane protein required for protein import [Tulasnella sp. 418]